MAYEDILEKLTEPDLPDFPPAFDGSRPSGLPFEGYYYSAYGIAVKHGFTGTEEDWLRSLRGADGEPGRDGTDGRNGTDGADGVGVESVVQTRTSTEPSGINEITVTLTNGESFVFQVRNGSGEGVGGMQESVYDPTGKATDIFAYARNAASQQVNNHDASPTAHSGMFASTFTETLDLAVDGWLNVGGCYMYEAESNVTEEDTPIVDLLVSSPSDAEYSRAEEADWAKVYYAEADSGVVRFYASEIPSQILSVTVKVVR